MRPALAVLAGVVLSVLLGGCGGSATEKESAPAAPRAQAVRDLTTLAPLKEAFNADAGKPRLLLILSPT